MADENKGKDIGEKALYGAFAAARDKRDLRAEKEIGERFINEYPKSQYLSDVMLTLGRHAAEAGRVRDAAAWLRADGPGSAVDSHRPGRRASPSARLKMAHGRLRRARSRSLESASDRPGPRKVEVLVLLAQTRDEDEATRPRRARSPSRC